jgi:hypothetical protein
VDPLHLPCWQTAPSTSVTMSDQFECSMLPSISCLTVQVTWTQSVKMEMRHRAKQHIHTELSKGRMKMFLTVDRLGCRNIVVALRNTKAL